MSRLIVLSNRIKFPDDKQAGGLAIAVANALQEIGGVWLGWNGQVTHLEQPTEKNATVTHIQDKVTFITTAFTSKQYQHFYCGFANSVLWAFLHNRMDLIDERAEDFTIYQQVNAQFAQQLSHIVQPDDVIWVHDYHFISVAHYCRSLGMGNRIGFFLHIPFAPSEHWQHCPQATNLLHHLTDYDVIGIQTQADKRHCQATLAPFLQGKPIIIDSYPIGVDVNAIEEQIEPHIQASTISPPVQPATIQIIAVDRIDYTKGILQRLRAFAQFLAQYPSYQGKIQLVQIAIPSRLDLPLYHELYETVKAEVRTIQQRFMQGSWQPIIYTETVLDHSTLMQLFFDSQVCWVNSLKDGMNLVAKEYIVAQNPSQAGVLLLSQYAGASEQMSEAIIIDPENESHLVASLLTAITMSQAERQARYHALIARLKQQDLIGWQHHFLQDLYQPNR